MLNQRILEILGPLCSFCNGKWPQSSGAYLVESVKYSIMTSDSRFRNCRDPFTAARNESTANKPPAEITYDRPQSLVWWNDNNSLVAIIRKIGTYSTVTGLAPPHSYLERFLYRRISSKGVRSKRLGE